MKRIPIGRKMVATPEVLDQYRREKAADLWLWDLMHYLHGTGKYASRKRDMIRKYHSDRDYEIELGTCKRGWYYEEIYLLPRPLAGHCVDVVRYDIEVNPDGSRVKIPSNFYHCVKCKLMGTETTMREYRCLGH